VAHVLAGNVVGADLDHEPALEGLLVLRLQVDPVTGYRDDARVTVTMREAAEAIVLRLD
jgi:hypothetical protein